MSDNDGPVLISVPIEALRGVLLGSVCHACYSRDWNGWCMNGAYHANLGPLHMDEFRGGPKRSVRDLMLDMGFRKEDLD
jgi:hypothetical protein